MMFLHRWFTVLLIMTLSISGPASAADSQPGQAENIHTELEKFTDIFTLLRDHYVEPINQPQLMQQAINGMLKTLDPHSSYILPTDYEKQKKYNRREYGGLGIEVTLENKLIKVNYANPGGPAAKAGIQTGDFISAVDGQPVQGKKLSEAVTGMRGPINETVTLTIIAEDQSPRDVKVTRGTVYGRAIRHRIEQGMAYIYIENFIHPYLDKDFKDAIQTLKQDFNGHIPGLILDMRNNPGGFLKQALHISSFFLKGGEILTVKGRHSENIKHYYAKEDTLLEDIPLVVLINQYSASAAEIVAGAIQDRGRGLIVGRRSFGKGSVQILTELGDGYGALRLTVQRYHTPSGKSIQQRGIIPNIHIAIQPKHKAQANHFSESRYENALEVEAHPALSDPGDTTIEYPPDTWPEDQDYQLTQAIKLLKGTRYHSLLATINHLP